METKSLTLIFVVSCVLLSLCLQPVSSQGIRWGREFEEDNPKMDPVKMAYQRMKNRQRSFDEPAYVERGKTKQHQGEKRGGLLGFVKQLRHKFASF